MKLIFSAIVFAIINICFW